MNKVLALDIGNVCVKIDPPRCIKQLGFATTPSWYQKALCQFECGKTTEKEFFQNIRINISDLTFSDEQLHDIFNSTLIEPVSGMVELVSSLPRRGVKVVFFSDISTLHLQNVRKKFPPALDLEGIYSFEAGAQKPSSQMFDAFERHYGKPDLYTDDRQELIIEARKRSWPSETFSSADELEKMLFN